MLVLICHSFCYIFLGDTVSGVRSTTSCLKLFKGYYEVSVRFGNVNILYIMFNIIMSNFWELHCDSAHISILLYI